MALLLVRQDRVERIRGGKMIPLLLLGTKSQIELCHNPEVQRFSTCWLPRRFTTWRNPTSPECRTTRCTAVPVQSGQAARRIRGTNRQQFRFRRSGDGDPRGTHIDALCHFFMRRPAAWRDPSRGRAILRRRSGEVPIDTVAPILRRGVLLDIAGLRGTLPGDFEITPAHLEEAARAEIRSRRRGVAAHRLGGLLPRSREVHFRGARPGVPL